VLGELTAYRILPEANEKGGNGYINDYSAGRLLRDSRLYTVGAGTQEIRRMLIGRGFNEQFAAVDGRVVAQ
jgi:isovaleryl-CoA dehydrogenase